MTDLIQDLINELSKEHSKKKPKQRHHYVPEEQSIYLMSRMAATQLKRWERLCRREMKKHHFEEIEYIGQGAYGFVLGGVHTHTQQKAVFKFSKPKMLITIQDRFEDEAFMLSKVNHPNVPKMIKYERSKLQAKFRSQSILIMERAKGKNLDEFCLLHGRLPPDTILKIAAQLAEILLHLREETSTKRMMVHGDIKPSNIIFDSETEDIALVDWGSSVFSQMDKDGNALRDNLMGLMAGGNQTTNAMMGDIYFIGPDQRSGSLTSPRFDEQALAGTLYALASGQSCRFGHNIIPATSLGLPKEFAKTLDAMLSDDPFVRNRAGDYFLKNMKYMKNISLPKTPSLKLEHGLKIEPPQNPEDIETAIYSSRKSFLMDKLSQDVLQGRDLEYVDRNYKDFLFAMQKPEKAFLTSVSRIGKYPVLGGVIVEWKNGQVSIDMNLVLYKEKYLKSLNDSLFNFVTLARSIRREGIFKACFFDAKKSLHLDREGPHKRFQAPPDMEIPFYTWPTPKVKDPHRKHSYFEDGQDSDEHLNLPSAILDTIDKMDDMHHTGMIIFESFPTHMKIHNHYVLMNPEREEEFRECLQQIIQAVPLIDGLGVSGFMKLPYKDIRNFTILNNLPEQFYVHPKQKIKTAL